MLIESGTYTFTYYGISNRIRGLEAKDKASMAFY